LSVFAAELNPQLSRTIWPGRRICKLNAATQSALVSAGEDWKIASDP